MRQMASKPRIFGLVRFRLASGWDGSRCCSQHSGSCDGPKLFRTFAKMSPSILRVWIYQSSISKMSMLKQLFFILYVYTSVSAAVQPHPLHLTSLQNGKSPREWHHSHHSHVRGRRITHSLLSNPTPRLDQLCNMCLVRAATPFRSFCHVLGAWFEHFGCQASCLAGCWK